ncbi:MAG: META domain-containing protein, partial [Gammaproteobacteria bacterium]|nr:META domain-containing protein [Gammaproteobacteria bacterium]
SSIGFATDYDGLFTVFKVFGLCHETNIVTQGDLQHHRWLLESINDKKIDIEKFNNRIPELDFGEQMMVFGNTGCNKFSAKAILHNETFALDNMRATRIFCRSDQNDLESMLNQMLTRNSKITLNPEKKLILENNSTRLVFYLKDWVH